MGTRRDSFEGALDSVKKKLKDSGWTDYEGRILFESVKVFLKSCSVQNNNMNNLL